MNREVVGGVGYWGRMSEREPVERAADSVNEASRLSAIARSQAACSLSTACSTYVKFRRLHSKAGTPFFALDLEKKMLIVESTKEKNERKLITSTKYIRYIYA